MKKFLIGFFTCLVLVVLVAIVYLQLISSEIKPADIQATAFRLDDNSVLVFVRDYFVMENQEDIQPFLLVADSNINSISVQTVPKGIIKSGNVILAHEKSKDKIWLLSPDYPDWVELDINNKKFTIKKNKEHPDIKNSFIMLKFRRSGRF